MARDNQTVRDLIARLRGMDDTHPDKEKLERVLMKLQGFYGFDWEEGDVPRPRSTTGYQPGREYGEEVDLGSLEYDRISIDSILRMDNEKTLVIRK